MDFIANAKHTSFETVEIVAAELRRLLNYARAKKVAKLNFAISAEDELEHIEVVLNQGINSNTLLKVLPDDAQFPPGLLDRPEMASLFLVRKFQNVKDGDYSDEKVAYRAEVKAACLLGLTNFSL
jgi:hypothetical protein